MSNTLPMLSTDDLSEMDEAVLDWMHEHPNITPTPTLLRKAFEERGMTHTRQYYNSILSRLAEHDHVRNLWDTGVYQLVSDPRDNVDRDEMRDQFIEQLENADDADTLVFDGTREEVDNLSSDGDSDER